MNKNMDVLAQGLELVLKNTNELKVMGYEEAMASPDKSDWESIKSMIECSKPMCGRLSKTTRYPQEQTSLT